MAAQAPERVRALLLQGPVFDPAYRTVARGLGRWTLDIPREKFSLGLREVPEWVRVGPRRVRRVLLQSLRDRLEGTLDTVATLGVPVRVVVGEHDTLSELPWQSTLSRPAAPPVVMAGLPHSAPHAAPGAVRSAGRARLRAVALGRLVGSRVVRLSFGLPSATTFEAAGPS